MILKAITVYQCLNFAFHYGRMISYQILKIKKKCLDQHNSILKALLLKIRCMCLNVYAICITDNLIYTYTNTLALTHSNPMYEYRRKNCHRIKAFCFICSQASVEYAFTLSSNPGAQLLIWKNTQYIGTRMPKHTRGARKTLLSNVSSPANISTDLCLPNQGQFTAQ